MRQARRPLDRPVFVDRSGRRRRLMKLAGASLGAALVAVLALMLAAMSGASRVQVPGFPDAGRHAGPATTPPAPTAGVTDPSGVSAPVSSTSTSTAATASQTTKRRVPTQTPDHPRPSKTR